MMKYKFLLKPTKGFLFTLMWVISLCIIAQNISVTGSVKDSNGESLPGVTILVKGTTNGTISDIDGNFTLARVPEDAVLEFSFVGMKTVEVSVAKKKIINVVLEEDSYGLDEVVVVGYGSQTKESVTGAISTVETKRLKQTSSVSLGSALAGRVSGLSAVSSSGQPGFDDPVMYLRGISTLNNASPLIIIDGVPREDIRQLHPTEIASISVLKDASATSIFGVRGANGAIIITTRRGQEGKGKLNINMEQGFTSFTKEPERLHSVEYFHLRNEAFQNDGLDKPYSDEYIARYENPLADLDPNDSDYASKKAVREYMYPDHDWYREFISRYTPQTRVNANFSGGTKKLSYYVYGGYIHQGGNFNTESKSFLGYDPSIKMDRYSFRANLDYKISSSFSTFLNLSSSLEKVNMPSPWRFNNDTNTMMLSLLQDAKMILPWTPGPTTIEGFGVDPGQTVEAPYMQNKSMFRLMNREGYRNEVAAISNSSWGVNMDLGKFITPGLKVSGMISLDSRATSVLQGNASLPYYNADINHDTNEMIYSLVSDEVTQLALTKSARSRYNMNLQGRVNYNRKFQKHNVGAMVLAQRDYWESYAADIPYNVLSLAGRATYDYDERYFGEVNLGYNGSEQFSPNKRFGFFPAFSFGWVASNEQFLKDSDILTFFKLRGSYGKAGNDKISSDRFLYQDNIQMGGGVLPSLGRGQGVNLGLLGNPNVSWEISLKKNIGIDFRIMNDFSASIDYFQEERSDILITRGLIPDFQGVPLSQIPKANMGEVDNKGFDFEINYNKAVNKDLSFMVSGNIGRYKNKVIYADEPLLDEDYAYRYTTTGFQLGQIFGYAIDWNTNGGYWSSEEEIENSPVSYDFGKPRPGDFIYIDQNGDGVINDKDRVPLGYSSRNPGLIYGLTLSTEYKGVDFMVFFQGVGEYSGYFNGVGTWENANQGSYLGYHKQAWTKERFDNNEKITYPALSTGNSTSHRPNDFFIMDRSYTRLRNIELGYTLPKKTLAGFGISGLRIYAAGQNLLTWDNMKGETNDPESENRKYPITKLINFGLEINF